LNLFLVRIDPQFIDESRTLRTYTSMSCCLVSHCCISPRYLIFAVFTLEP